MKHLPNALSISRIALTPVFLVALLSTSAMWQLLALALFILLAISDWLDGALARKYGAGTRFGQFLDPLADKVLVLGAFVAFMFLPPDAQGRTIQSAWWWIPVLLIAGRDFAVTGLRTWAERNGWSIATRKSAKAKTAVQLTFLIAVQVFMVGRHLSVYDGFWGGLGEFSTWLVYSPLTDILLVFTALLTVWTGIQYFGDIERPDVVTSHD